MENLTFEVEKLLVGGRPHYRVVGSLNDERNNRLAVEFRCDGRSPEQAVDASRSFLEAWAAESQARA